MSRDPFPRGGNQRRSVPIGQVLPAAVEHQHRRSSPELWPNLGDGGLREAAYRGG